jgi:hypothetical protein
VNNLISLDQAKAQLRITDTDSDDELTSVMIPGASAIVASYLKWPTEWPYTADTLPPHMVTAVLLVLSSLYEDREGANDPIGPAVASILARDRDPALV